MDYDDNDFQSQNLHLAGEGNNKFPPVLRPYALPRFDFDDNLHAHLRFDSLVETEVFLGIESSEDNNWIEDFSRGTSGIAFSSAAAEPCSISRHNNVWSEAASSESVEMLLKSVGQDETIPGQSISKDSDACDELGCIVKQMEPSLKHVDSGFSEMRDDTQMQTGETPGKFSGLKADVGGDNMLVENVSQTHEVETSVGGALSAPESIGRNDDLPVTEVDDSKGGEQIVVNENQINISIDQSVDIRGQEDNFVSESQVDTVIPSVQNSCKSSSLIDSQDIMHINNDIIDENVDSLSKDNVGLNQEVHIDGNGKGTVNYEEPSDKMVRGNSDEQMVEVCDRGMGGEISFKTGKSQNLVLSEGKLEDLTLVSFIGDTTPKEHESNVSGPDTTTCTSLDSKMDITVPKKCDSIEKNLLIESGPSTKTHSSESEKSLLLVEHGKVSKDESEGANDTSGAEAMKACDLVTEPKDDYNCDQSVSAAANLNTKLPSDCSNVDCGNGVSPHIKEGVDSLSLSSGGTVKELASNLQSDVAASSMSVDCAVLTSGKDLHANAVFVQKEVQVSNSEASSSIMTTSSGTKTEKGAACETDEQFPQKKVDQPLPLDDTYNAENQSSDQLLHGVILNDEKDMRASSLACDSTVRETDSADAQVISERDASEASGVVLVHHNGKIPSKSVPSTSTEPYHDTGRIRLEETDPKLVSEEKISDHVAVNQDMDVTPDSQNKLHKIVRGGSADLDSPSCGSPIVIRTSEQSQRLENENVKGSADQTASASGVMNGKASKGLSISQDNKGNDASLGDKSFTFEVPPLPNLSDKEAGKNWQPFPTVQPDKISSVLDGSPSTSSLSKVSAKTAQDASPANLQPSDRKKVRGGSKGTSEHKTRRSGGKAAGKEASKKGTAAKETTPARQSERSDRISNVPLGSAGSSHLIQSNEMQHYGHAEVFHQPFTDLQQVQLRAQIFVYGALIQGVAPDEAYMISAFGGPDGGRTIWENAWRACVDRLHGQKSILLSPETSSQSRIAAKASDQPIKQNALQSKVTASPSTIKGTPTTVVNTMIPLSSPLWSIPTPSGDALQPTGIPRGAVMEYQQGLSPLHPPAIRNFVGHNAPWISQSPFRAPWVPHTSTFDVNARFPVLPMTEPVNLTPVREASVPHSSGMKQVSPVPMNQTGSPTNVFAGPPVADSKKVTLTPGQHSADPKPRKRKKLAVSEDTGQIMWQLQTEQQFPNVLTSHSSTPAALTTPATIVSKSSMEKFITSSSTDHLKKGNENSDQRATLSEETLSKLKEAQKQAEDASALAAAAISHSQEIWNQLGKCKNSGLAPDIENKLTSAAVAIAAAAAVAKAAAAAAKVAADAGFQAKLMADEALVSISSSDSVTKLGKATPASIFRGEDATASSSSVIVAAREASRRRVEATTAASKQAENMDAVVKASELAAVAVSQAGKIVAMGEPFSLIELVEAGPNAYWKAAQPSPEPDGTIKDPIDKSANHEMSPTLREMARESMEDRTRVADGILGPAATSRKDRKGQKSRKASDIATTKGATSGSEQGFGLPSLTTSIEKENAGEVSKDSNLTEGSHVEVLRDGGGMKVAWFLADILNLKDGKAYVCYNELRSEDGEQLKEWVELDGEGDRAPRIRSTRSITAMPFEGTRKRRRAAMGDYNWSIGDRVDAWMQDRWWEGVVTEKSKKEETSFTIHFPAQGETSVVKAWLLRPSLIWKNGSWVEWSSSGANNSSSHEGDTPQEKRLRISSHSADAKGKDNLPKGFDTKDSGKPDDIKLLDLSAGDRVFNIGKSTSNESKPGPLRMMRTGLQKEGSRVIFGVPKQGKKRKFMEVSKHYVADQSKKTNETSDSAKFTKYLMPQGSGPRGVKNKVETRDKRPAVPKPKVLKSGKPPTISGRTIPQKDGTSNTIVSEPDDAVPSDRSKLKDSASNVENISGKHNMIESRSFSSSDGGATGPVYFSSIAVSSDAPSKKSSTPSAKSERINRGKQATTAGKTTKTEEEKVGNDNSTKAVSEVEPRRSNRRIQPTSRLLEGLQSSLITSKIPSISHDKSHKSQSKSSRGNTHG